jgi:Zn-dependent M28 family amino/carboxypeptidase
MKIFVAICLAACAAPGPGGSSTTPDAPREIDGGPSSGDPYANMFASVDKMRLETLLRDMTGYNAIQINGQSVRISERYTPASKANWRAYWKQYYTALGATVHELTFPVSNLVGETTGHNLEAVFPGHSADSIVAIVHYDSTGAPGKEVMNPGVDDNMTPMAIQMEAARLLAQYKDNLDLTVRFVATDYEEITTLAGGKAYVAYLQAEAQAKTFKIVAAVDGELSGWNCWAENKCLDTTPPPPKSTFVVASCTTNGKYKFPAIGQQMKDIATKYSSMKVALECDNDTDGSELYNFWRIGVPAFYFEEYANDGNTYYDEGGSDTLARIDLDYYFKIGQVAPLFIAKLVGITPTAN